MYPGVRTTYPRVHGALRGVCGCVPAGLFCTPRSVNHGSVHVHHTLRHMELHSHAHESPLAGTWKRTPVHVNHTLRHVESHSRVRESHSWVRGFHSSAREFHSRESNLRNVERETGCRCPRFWTAMSAIQTSASPFCIPES